MHSVELVLDGAADGRIRAQWTALMAAGLPSQARHTGASNRPHITLALAASLNTGDLARLIAATVTLPIPLTIGGLLVFGSRRFVLARLVVPSAALLDLQAGVTSALAEPVDPHHTFAPGRWTPHVTLARRLTADQLAEAATVLGEVPPVDAHATSARRWDITAKQEHWIGG